MGAGVVRAESWDFSAKVSIQEMRGMRQIISEETEWADVYAEDLELGLVQTGRKRKVTRGRHTEKVAS